MRTPLALLAPLLLGFAVLVATPATAQPPAPAKSTALAAVPTDSFAFLTVNVAKLYDTPGFKPLRDWIAGQPAGTLDRVFGLTAADVERITVFAPIADPDTDFDPLFLVKTRRPYNEAKVLKALAAGRVDELVRPRVTGRVVEIAEGKLLHWLVFVDDSTLLFAPKHALEDAAGVGLVAHLLAPKKDGPLAEALADATKHDLALGVDIHGLRALLPEERIRRERELVPYLALFKARTLTFAADFDKSARGSLKLTFADAGDAKRAAAVLKEGMGDVAGHITKQLAERKDRMDPAEQVFLESAASVLKAAKVEAEGTNVFATADVSYQDVVTKFATALPKSLEAAASDTKAKNNLKQLALAMHNYESTYQVLPSDVYPAGGQNPPAWSWRVQILPFIEQENLYKQLDFMKAWDDPANLKKLEAMQMPKVFELPGRPAPKGYTYFRVFTRPKNAKGTDRPLLVEGQKGPNIVSITDGTSNTLMIVEAGEAVPWYKPDVLGYDGTLPLPQLGDKAADRFLAAMGDGSVRTLKPGKLGEKTLRALITIQGGEVVTLP